ncbi:MAG: hypothetical protein ACE5JX_04115 [Acidobacteriota bacterium]
MKQARPFLTLLALLWVGTWAYAHGPQVRIDKSTAAPGEVLTVSGEGITSNGEIRITLKGILQDYSLAVVQGDEHGRFEQTVVLPDELQPGSYTLLASGDQKATVKLRVGAPSQAGRGAVAASESEHSHAGREEQAEAADHHEDEGGHSGAEKAHEHSQGEEGHEEREAQAGPMPIQRAQSGAEAVVSWGTVLLSAALGLGLLVRGRGKS